MEKEKLYSRLNTIKAYLWIFATIFGLAGMYSGRNYLLHITVYILYALGISQIAMYCYFRKSSDISGISPTGKVAAAVTFILSASQFYGGYYLLTYFP